MKILDKLESIFKGKFGDILSNNKITLFDFSKNETSTLEVKGEGGSSLSLSIDLSKTAPEERKKIKEEIIDVLVQDEEEAILTGKSSEKTKQIKENLPVGDDEELLRFYKDKLSPEMHRVLEISLVVRNSFGKNENITDLKKDIARRYPIFGRNLCNLTSQGYFHGHFKELYDSMMEEEEFDMGAYRKKVEKIVKSLPYTVFVAQSKSLNELGGEIEFKLERLMKYGTGQLLIHGLGAVNVKTALKILKYHESREDISIDIDMNPKKTYITATLTF